MPLPWGMAESALPVAVAGRAREAATSPWALVLARFGYVARGVVYVVVGWLAALAAFGNGGDITDSRGALEVLNGQPQGTFLVGVVAVGLLGYAAWRLARGVCDLERKGTEAKGLASRGGDLAAAVVYGGLALAAANLALGAASAGPSSDGIARDSTAHLLGLPFGPALVVAAGLAFLGNGAFQLYRAYTASFREKLDLSDLSPSARAWIIRFGRAGLAARGVVFGLIGVFLVQAARQHTPDRAIGLGGALHELARQPSGELLLGAMAVGLATYGLFSLAEARYRRLPRG